MPLDENDLFRHIVIAKMKFENVRELLERRAERDPEKAFLFSEGDGRTWSYNEFDRSVNRTANLLKAHGIEKGEVVSLLLPNSAEYVIAYFACWSIGAIAGPVNSLLKPEEIEWTIAHSESKLMLSGSEFLGPLDGIAVPPRIVFDDEALATAGISEDPGQTAISPDDDAIIIYTSGTTGKPKGCLLTHNNLIANARQISSWMGFGPDDRLLSVMPLFHMNAVTVTTLTAMYCRGSTVVAPKFSASKFWETIEKYAVTSFGSVATMLSMLLARSEQSANSSQHAKASPRSEHEKINRKSKIQNPKSTWLVIVDIWPGPASFLRSTSPG
jgi:acyl-CoA synthetase (AMP-forming)/AMP-acid ligase II